jgi:hypothetical protein
VKTIIHVNQHIIKANLLHGTSEPPLTIKTYKSNTHGNEADILDKDGNVVATIIHRPHNPLSCGARVWIETQNEVVTR